MQFFVKAIALRLAAIAAIFLCAFPGRLAAQQLYVGVVREKALLRELNPLLAIEFAGSLPISKLVSLQMRFDHGTADRGVRRDSIMAYSGFDTRPPSILHAADMYGAAVAFPLTFVSRSTISVSLSPGFRLTRMQHSIDFSPRFPATEDWRTFAGPQLGARATFTPHWSPVGISLGGEWARIRANRVSEASGADPFRNTLTSSRFSVGLTWTRAP
jgi:hypothetical protein